jgi:hypothetical protein
MRVLYIPAVSETDAVCLSLLRRILFSFSFFSFLGPVLRVSWEDFHCVYIYAHTYTGSTAFSEKDGLG